MSDSWPRGSQRVSFCPNSQPALVADSLLPIVQKLVALGGLCLLLFAMHSRSVTKAAPEVSPIRFRNVAKSAGLDFVLENSPTPQKHLIETMAGGIAVFDYNGDGLPDIFFTNGAAISSLEKDSPKYFNRL